MLQFSGPEQIEHTKAAAAPRCTLVGEGWVGQGHLIDGVPYCTTGSYWAVRADLHATGGALLEVLEDDGRGYLERARAMLGGAS